MHGAGEVRVLLAVVALERALSAEDDASDTYRESMGRIE